VPQNYKIGRRLLLYTCSGAGTNLKVGGTGPEQKWGGAPSAPRVLALKAQLVVLVSAFVMVSSVWSVSCLLFFYSRCPPCPTICKWGGGTCHPFPMESAPLYILPVQCVHRI